MDKSPEISVLMPVFNTECYLKQAIDSVLNQTFRDFELIVINDGSTDSSEKIVLSYSDSRIKYYKNSKNIGIVASRNKGIDLCGGRFIALLDSDDVALPDRLQKQWDFLNTHPEFVMVGGFVEKITSDNRHIRRSGKYCPPPLIKTQLFFRNTFAQSTMLIRADVIKEFRYSDDYSFYAEDYFLWTQIAFKYPVANLPEVLAQYRVHRQSVTIRTKETDTQRNAMMKVHVYHLNKLNINPSSDELDLHYKLLYNPAAIALFDKNERKNITAWVEKVLKQNEILQVYDPKYFAARLKYRWSLKKKLHIIYMKVSRRLVSKK
jgi:glycosyltransferase involved in cell wall biosynthesis